MAKRSWCEGKSVDVRLGSWKRLLQVKQGPVRQAEDLGSYSGNGEPFQVWRDNHVCASEKSF